MKDSTGQAKEKQSTPSPLTGKGKSKGGKGAHTEKRKASRPRCRNCGRHGHVEKDCRNVAALTDENEEACNNWKYTVVKTGQIGLDHVPTTGVIALTMTGHSWTGMVTRTGTTLVGMTTGPGVLEVTPLTLQFCLSPSDQLHPIALPRSQIVSLARNPELRLHRKCQHLAQL